MSALPLDRIQTLFLDAGNTLFTERTARPALYNQIALSHGGLDDVDAMRSAMTSAIRDLPTSVEGHFRYSLAWFRAFNERVLGQCGVADEAKIAASRRLIVVDVTLFAIIDVAVAAVGAVTGVVRAVGSATQFANAELERKARFIPQVEAFALFVGAERAVTAGVSAVRLSAIRLSAGAGGAQDENRQRPEQRWSEE